jgi:ABC-type lipoprotein release transport system permease subunit
VCAADSLGKVRTEIGRVLPDTQVIEFQSQTLARAEARRRAGREAEEAIAREKDNRARLRQERESFASILVPVVLVASALWVAFLSFSNVRDRRAEIGLLRALGVRSPAIMAIFLGRALFIGLVGALLGLGVGFLIGAAWPEAPAQSPAAGLDLRLVLSVLAGAPFVAMLAGWLPAYLAAQQDPAEVLSGE